MYVIEHLDGETRYYFSRFGPLGMAEYVAKSYPEKMRKFETKKEASIFAKQMLRGKHSVIEIKEG